MMIKKVIEAHYDSFLDKGTWYVIRTGENWDTVLFDVYQGGKRSHTRAKIDSLGYGLGFLKLVSEFVRELPIQVKGV